MLDETVSHYRVLRQLGSGGMGVVYEAEDISLGRKVALKFLLPDLGRGPGALERFQREAHAASSLNHPHICTIHAIEQHEGQWFIVMELLEGKPLDQRVMQPLTLSALVDIGVAVADALGAAHQKGIVHRDIKPANIFILPKGGAKVLDFGLAKLAAAETHIESVGATAGLTAPAHLTSPGTVIGTVAYMSPEQARGEELDARTDLFSFGAVMYQMATGKLPFQGNTSAVIFAAILEHDPTPIADLNPELPAKLGEIISKCLEKDRDLRYQTAAELRGDLKRLKRDLDSGRVRSHATDDMSQPPSAVSGAIARAPSGSSFLVAVARQHKLGAVVGLGAAVLLVLAALFGVYSLLKPSARAPFQAISINKAPGTHNARLAAMSPDGNYLAYVINQDGNESLWLRHLASDSNVQIVKPALVQYNAVRFSPDGSYIYYTHTELASGPAAQDYDLYRTPVLGGSAQLLIKDIDTNISFSPDGRRFVFERANDPEPGKFHLLIANTDGMKETSILTGPARESVGSPSWSPDGKTIVGRMLPSGETLTSLISVDVATGATRKVFTSTEVILSNVSWTPDGKALAVIFSAKASNFSRNQVGIVTYPEGKFRAITSDTNNYQTLSVSSDGATIATVMSQSDRNVFVNLGQVADESGFTQVTSGDPIATVSWTEDGKLLAEQDGIVYVIGSDGSSRSTLVGGKDSFAGRPSGCPDGRVVFTRATHPSVSLQIWRVDADGTNVRQLTHGPADDFAACSPDGKWALYVDRATRALMRVPLDGDGPQRVGATFTEFAGLFDISADRKSILIGTYDFTARKPNISLVDFDSGKVLRIFQYDPRHAGRLCFTPDGKGFVYPIRDKGVDNLWLQPLDGGPGRQLTNFTSQKIYAYRWSMHGQQLALVRGDSPSDLVLVRDARQMQ